MARKKIKEKMKKKKNDISKRVGIVKVAISTLMETDKDFLDCFFSGVYPLQSELDFSGILGSPKIKYRCVSKYFDKVEVGTVIPEYIIKIEKINGKYKRHITRFTYPRVICSNFEDIDVRIEVSSSFESVSKELTKLITGLLDKHG